MTAESSPSPHADKPPRKVVRLGKYEISKHIATGGMGAVYKARDTVKKRDVALKIMTPETMKDERSIERFKREARSASRLHHDNIVHVYEYGEIDGRWFLAMEYIEGIDLHDYVKKKGPVDPEEARQLMLQAARALRHASEQNIVHRDVKPSNILLIRRAGRSVAKLTDFGLAREVDANEFAVTSDGNTVGTIDYMSPEQARNSRSADIRSDLYSLGCTWYFLLTGHAPFADGGLGERLIKILNEPPADVRMENPKVSEDAWTVLSCLLAKNPDERYQSPTELIDDLIVLEGHCGITGPSQPQLAPRKSVKKPAKPDTRNESTALTVVIGNVGLHMKYVLAGLAVLLVVVVATVANLSESKKPKAPQESTTTSQPEEVIDHDRDDAGKTATPDDKGNVPADKGKAPELPTRPRWPWLYSGADKVDAKALRQEIEAPWAVPPPAPANAFTARVSRSPGAANFPSLADACAAAPADRAIVIEIHDNGPIIALPATVAGRDLTIRAGKGYRPLIVWDLPATLAERRRLRKTDQPLVFLQVVKGRLSLEGIEFAWRWPETLAEPSAFLDVRDGELSVYDCTFSAAGKPATGASLVRFIGSQAKARCRLNHCHIRGSGLTALDLVGPAEVLIDSCLLVGGGLPLLRVHSEGDKGPNLRVVRSTLVCGRTLLELHPSQKIERSPGLSWFGWDSLLTRSSNAEGGELLAVRDGADAGRVGWRAVNCLYAGWGNLLAGPTKIAGEDLTGWQRQWKRTDGDGVVRDPWPDQVFNEPAWLLATTYQPIKAVGFASTIGSEYPLGCDLPGLPPARDNWLRIALEPSLSPPEALADDSVPAIPEPGDGRFHGARIDLSETDLGAYLAQMQSRAKLGPRVVMHLTGKGDAVSSPITIKGSTLVLYFEEPANKDAQRLAIRLGSVSSPTPLITMENGGLDVIGGVLRATDSVTAHISHLIHVKGGDVRLYRTRLEGPQQTLPDGYRSAIYIAGSGDPTTEKMRICTLTECVVLSSRAGIHIDGVGCRLLLRQSVIVAATEGLQLMPGPECKGRAGMPCFLENVTFACRSAVLRLGDAPAAGVPTEPIVVQARDCAYLNPFPGKSSKAGLLLVEGDALGRGLLVWQGRREGFDYRLFFAAANADAALPDVKNLHAPWRRLWGTSGVIEPRPELATRMLEFDPRRWALERLLLFVSDAPGANLRLLNIPPRKKSG